MLLWLICKHVKLCNWFILKWIDMTYKLNFPNLYKILQKHSTFEKEQWELLYPLTKQNTCALQPKITSTCGSCITFFHLNDDSAMILFSQISYQRGIKYHGIVAAVQSLGRVWLFVTPQSVACQACYNMLMWSQH